MPVVIGCIERVRAVVAEDMERVANIVDADAIEEFARGELDIEAVIHRGLRVLRMQAFEGRIVVPIARRIGDVLQLAGAGRNEIACRRLRRWSSC